MTMLCPLPRALVVAVLSAVALATPGCKTADPSAVTPELRQRAVEVLRDVLASPSPRARTRAAHYLLALDYRAGVRDAFEVDLVSSGNEPHSRIDRWGVLAGGAARPQERGIWVEKIENVLYDTSAPDRLVALETLAKLGTYPASLQPESSDDSFDHGPLSVYANWIRAANGVVEAESSLAALMNDSEPVVRAQAGYVLFELPQVSPETSQSLDQAASREPATTLASAFLTSAALVHGPEDRRASWKDALVKHGLRGNQRQRFQLCAALARVGVDADLPVLEQFFEDTEPGVRAAAANAILRIGRRVPHQMTWLDWAAIAVYGFGMLLVGWYYSRRVKTTEDYLLGGRNMRPWAVGLSLFATLLSTLSYVAVPGEIIKYGPMIASGALAAPFVVLVVGWVLIPRIMKLGVTSAYEILQARLGTGIRIMGSLIFLTIRLFWMAAIIYATSRKILLPVLGIDDSWYPWICLILVSVTLAYTSMGGLRAVVFTDVVQTFILLGGALLTLGTITVIMGGVVGWWPTAWPESWQEPKFGFETDARVTVGFAFLAGFVWHICTAGSDQMAIQRYLSTRDVRGARRAMFTQIATDTTVMMLMLLLGLSLFGYFHANPHRVPDGQTIYDNADQLFPHFIVFGLPIGISGLVVAGLLATAMSSLSSGVNSSCSVITVDFIDRLRQQKMEDAEHVSLAKYVSVVVGVIVLGLTAFVSIVPGNLVEVINRVVNLLVSPLFVLFFLAMFVPWATTFGAWVGVTASIIDAVLIAFWELFTGEPGPTFLWIMPTSLCVGAVTGMLASLVPVGPKARPPLAELTKDYEGGDGLTGR
jgi:SSS family solute:Na+ symporter